MDLQHAGDLAVVNGHIGSSPESAMAMSSYYGSSLQANSDKLKEHVGGVERRCSLIEERQEAQKTKVLLALSRCYGLAIFLTEVQMD
jgi:hypothetical protein